MKKITLAAALISIFALASCDNTINSAKQDAHSLVEWTHNKPSMLDRLFGGAPVGYRDQSAQQAATTSTDVKVPAPAPQEKAAEPEKSTSVAKEPVEPVEKADIPPPAAAPATAPAPIAPVAAETVKTPAPPERSMQPLDLTKSPSPQAENAPPAPSGSKALVWHQVNDYDAQDPSLQTANDAADYSFQPAPLMPSPQMAAGDDGAVKFNDSVTVYPLDDGSAPYSQVNTSNSYSNYDHQRIAQVYFPYGSSNVDGSDRTSLAQVAQSLSRNSKDYRLTVIGHASRAVIGVTSALKRKLINFKMAQKRADAVAHVLIAAGAAPDWIEAQSVGATQPNPHRGDMSQQSADQRAEIFLSTN